MNAHQLRLESATVEDFTSLLGESFTLTAEEAGETIASVTLAQANPSPYTRDGARVGFSLIFEGPADIALPQQIYWLNHAATGTIGIFLVPISGDENCRRYQAVFN